MYINKSLLFVVCVSLLVGCSKETISPETFGNIEGKILDSENSDGIPSVNITTTPATNSILTDNNGSFVISEVPTGTYTINADKKGYESNSVSVKVSENKTASAQMYLDEDADNNSSENLSAEVTSWNDRVEGDTTFVEVEYKVKNNGEDAKINEYEIYFEVLTNGGSAFYHEVRDTSLAAGEQNIGSFEKYIRQNQTDTVLVSDTYAE